LKRVVFVEGEASFDFATYISVIDVPERIVS
jgi:hypothetical protein